MRATRSIAEAVRRHDCRIMSQLTHMDRRSQSDVESWQVLLAPSQIPEKVHREVPDDLEPEQIAVPSAPGVAGVRVWYLMSRGRGPRTGPPPPEGVHVTYPHPPDAVQNHFFLVHKYAQTKCAKMNEVDTASAPRYLPQHS